MRPIEGPATSMMSISVRNWIFADSRWLVCGGAVLLEPDGYVNVGQYALLGLVVGDRAAADGFRVGQVHR